MIDFLKYKTFYFLFSAIVIVVGLISIVTGGLKYSIEFTGGTNLEYKLNKNVATSKLRKSLEKNNVEVAELRETNNIYTVKTKPIDEKKEVVIRNDIEKELSTKITVLRVETVGPVLGKELLQKTIIASILSMIGILLYIAYAFRSFNFAMAAIGALLHDILVLVGVYSLLGRFFGAEVDTLFVTALLTGMSFSVHDTIIIFDRIREYKKAEGIANFQYHANKALLETLVRSVNNSMTIVFMLLSLTLLGGTTIKFFVAALLIGTLTGAYSSPFIATPLLLLLEKSKK